MKYSLSMLLVIFLGLQATAQEFPEHRFHKGEVMLNDGSVYAGQIKYDLDADVIFFQSDKVKGVSTYNANQFKSFRILPLQAKKARVFYTLPYRNDAGYRRPKIFEAIYEDKVSLVGREYIVVKSRPISNGFYRRSVYDPFYDPRGNFYTSRYLAYNLYIVNQEGGISLLGKNRREVLRSFNDHQSELKKFMKKEKLRMEKLEDITRLVEYYNGLENL